MSLFLERAWFAARLGPWWICWETFQFTAIVAGAVLLFLRSRERGHLWAYAVGIACAVPGALIVGGGAEFAGSGALIAFLGGYALTCRQGGVGLLPAFDAVAPSIAAILFFSRLGCFVGGCDFGTPSNLPWAVRFPIGTAAFRAQLDRGQIGAGRLLSLPVHPTQLYEAAAGLFLLVVLILFRPSKRPGADIAFVLFSYAAARFVVDSVRGDLVRGLMGFTLTQGMSLSVLALGLVAVRILPRTDPPVDSLRAEARSRNSPL